MNRFLYHLTAHCFMQCDVYSFSLHIIHSTLWTHQNSQSSHNRELMEREEHLSQVLQENDHLYEVVRTASHPRQQRTQEQTRHTFYIPYVSGLVYEIPCSCGQSYIGETMSALETRLKEHQAATRRGKTEKSAVAEHAWSQHHQPLWGEIKVLDRAGHNTILQIKEALHISLRNPRELANRGQSLSIDGCWKHLINRLLRRQPQSRT